MAKTISTIIPMRSKLAANRQMLEELRAKRAKAQRALEQIDKKIMSLNPAPAPPAYEFYEVVTLAPEQEAQQDLRGQSAAVLGREQAAAGKWVYTVWVYRQTEAWFFQEHELRPTGKFVSRADLLGNFTTGQS